MTINSSGTPLHNIILERNTLLLEAPVLLNSLFKDLAVGKLYAIFGADYLQSLEFELLNIYQQTGKINARPEVNCWQVTSNGPWGLAPHGAKVNFYNYQFIGKDNNVIGSVTLLGSMLSRDANGVYNILEIDGVLTQPGNTSFIEYLNNPSLETVIFKHNTDTYDHVFNTPNLLCSIVSGLGFGVVSAGSAIIEEELADYLERNFFDSYSRRLAQISIPLALEFIGHTAVYCAMSPYLTSETLLLAAQNSIARTAISASIRSLNYLAQQSSLCNSSAAKTVVQAISETATVTCLSLPNGVINALSTTVGFLGVRSIAQGVKNELKFSKDHADPLLMSRNQGKR